MNKVKNTINYIETINGVDVEKSFSYEARLDMKCLRLVQNEMKENGLDLKIYEIFNEIKKLNVQVISSIVLNSIDRCTDASREKIMKCMEFNHALNLINDLLRISMPLIESKNDFENVFEDDDEDINDWDFDYMTYLWYSVLKRNDDFYDITPKYFFSQIEIHKQFTGIKSEEQKVEYL